MSCGRPSPKIVTKLVIDVKGVWEHQRWQGRPRQKSSPMPQPDFTTTNRFESLSSPSAAKPNSVLVIGDSIVRNVDLGGKAVLSCNPRARVLDIGKIIPGIFRRHKDININTVVIHAGVNDMKNKQSEVLKTHFSSLLNSIRTENAATRIVLSGPLPTFKRGSEIFSRLFALHSWLKTCSARGDFEYVNNWNSFWERPRLYRRAGLHPSRYGAALLTDQIRAVLDSKMEL
uniref:SGNH hydrolase-type esterase domain-containing protein n=1 Tax=Paramormyrops kingsleyae TaxID=1676925 RepID=A0A3B3RVQ0_9TELE